MSNMIRIILFLTVILVGGCRGGPTPDPSFIRTRIVARSGLNERSLEEIYADLAFVERLYSAIGLRFHIVSIELVPNLSWEWAELDKYGYTNMLSIYYVPSISYREDNNMWGLSEFPWTSEPARIMIAESCEGDVVLAHEIGHLFGLYHVCRDEEDEVVDTPQDNRLGAFNIMGTYWSPLIEWQTLQITPGQLARIQKYIQSDLKKIVVHLD